MSWATLESNAYWTLFTAALLVVGVWEMYRPWRKVSEQLGRRWRSHALLIVASGAITVLIFRASLVMIAVTASHSRFGLLNRPWLPPAIRFVAGFLLLDFLSYVFHRVSHAFLPLWKVHQVHHSDPDFDLSNGFRNHPLETLINQAAYSGAIALLAPPPAAVLAAQLAAMLAAFFTHANANLPGWIDKPLRRIFVTPGMHRVHHSEEVPEQMANFGEILPWWDRLFGTYLEAPAAGSDSVRMGLQGVQSPAAAGFLFMLMQPFRARPTSTEIREIR